MEHKSTFNLTIGNALIQQIDVKADVIADSDDWYIDVVYADALQIGGECPDGEAYVEIPKDHYLYWPVLHYFEMDCEAAITERWRRRHQSGTAYSTISAGRTL